MAHIKESTHFYDLEGNPAYTVKGKNGEDRATTLRDARLLNLVPSVTVIIGESNKPGLLAWKENQVLMAALTLPRIEGEDESDWVSRIKQDAKEHAKNAAERGTQIHTWIQQGFEGEKLSEEGVEYYTAACKELLLKTGCVFYTCEKSFTKEGYGGKVDLHTPEYVIDIKTKDTALDKVQTYDEHAMQLSAYRHGLSYPEAKCGILFVSTLNKSAKLVWIDEDKLLKGWLMFNALKEYWYAKSGLKEAI